MPFTKKQFQKEVQKEHSEHPWTTMAQARRIVFDHHPSLKKQK